MNNLEKLKIDVSLKNKMHIRAGFETTNDNSGQLKKGHGDWSLCDWCYHITVILKLYVGDSGLNAQMLCNAKCGGMWAGKSMITD